MPRHREESSHRARPAHQTHLPPAQLPAVPLSGSGSRDGAGYIPRPKRQTPTGNEPCGAGPRAPCSTVTRPARANTLPLAAGPRGALPPGCGGANTGHSLPRPAAARSAPRPDPAASRACPAPAPPPAGRSPPCAHPARGSGRCRQGALAPGLTVRGGPAPQPEAAARSSNGAGPSGRTERGELPMPRRGSGTLRPTAQAPKCRSACAAAAPKPLARLLLPEVQQAAGAPRARRVGVPAACARRVAVPAGSGESGA